MTLEFGKPHDIKRMSEFSGNIDVLLYSEGIYDDYQVMFIPFENRSSVVEFFAGFDPAGKNILAFFHIQGDIMMPVAEQRVTRLGIPGL